MTARPKILAVNADDFGFTPDVNEGIVRANREGILTSTTLMATGEAFDDAVRLAKQTPSLDIGVHGVLVGDPPFPLTVGALMRAVMARRMDPKAELRKQVRRIVDAGLRPSHMDTHKHTHLFPPILDAVLEVATEFDIPWVRKPFDLPLPYENVPATKKLVTAGIGLVRGRFASRFAQSGRRATDHFVGFQITGRYGAPELARLIRALPNGTTEFMCHPGILGSALGTARTRLKESRAIELAALVAPEVRAAVQESDIRLSGFDRLTV